MTSLDFRGVYPAMTTPFHDDGRIDFETLRSYATRLVDAGVDGVVPVGSTGESATLTHDEHVEVIEAVVDEVDVPVVAGAGSNATHEAVRLSERAADAGADALLHISPYYNKPEQAGFREHYETVADAVDLPQVVYNVPSRTGRSLAPETVAELAEHPNVVAYKAASGDLELVSEVVERAPEGFAVLSGDDGLTLPVCSVGGVGTVSVVANVEPERTCALVGAALAGDYERARRIHRRLAPLVRQLFVETNPIPVVEANRIRGYTQGNLRSPLTRLSGSRREALATVLADLERDRADLDDEPPEASR